MAQRACTSITCKTRTWKRNTQGVHNIHAVVSDYCTPLQHSTAPFSWHFSLGVHRAFHSQITKFKILMLSSLIMYIIITLRNISESRRNATRQLLAREAHSNFFCKISQCVLKSPCIMFSIAAWTANIIPLAVELQLQDFFMSERRCWNPHDKSLLMTPYLDIYILIVTVDTQQTRHQSHSYMKTSIIRCNGAMYTAPFTQASQSCTDPIMRRLLYNHKMLACE